MTRRYYGPDKAAVEQAKRERKEAKRRKQKDARTLGPVRFGDTGMISQLERNDDGDGND